MSADNNAMTEVALALAMAFFSIFILAAVSMSQQNIEAVLKQDTSSASKQVHELNLSDDQTGERSLSSDEAFLIFYKGQFYNAELETTSLASVQKDAALVVGVVPTMSIGEMNRLKEKNRSNLAITLLNEEWQQRLERL